MPAHDEANQGAGRLMEFVCLGLPCLAGCRCYDASNSFAQLLCTLTILLVLEKYFSSVALLWKNRKSCSVQII